MKNNFIRIRQTAGLIFIFFLLVLNFHTYFNSFVPNQRPNPEGMADIPGTIISYFTNWDKMTWLWDDLLFGRGLQGSVIYVKYLILIMLFMPSFYLVQCIVHWLYPSKKQYRVFWTSWPHIIFTELFTFYAATVNGIAQAEGWYHNPVYNFPGTFDVATHFNIGTVICSWLLTFAWAQWAKIDRIHPELAQLFDETVVFLQMMFLSLYFEYVEFINPDRYWNLVGNSYSDMAAAVIFGFLLASYAYDKLVPAEIGEYGWAPVYAEGIRKRLYYVKSIRRFAECIR